MRKIHSILIAAAVIFLAGCTRETAEQSIVPVPFVLGEEIALSITQDGCVVGSGAPAAATRTIVKNNTEIWWEEGDAVGIYAEGGSAAAQFTSTLGDGQTAAQSYFRGTITEAADKYYVVYPYSDAQGVFIPEPKQLNLSIPAGQTARAGSFDKEMMPSLGAFTPSETSFTMKPLCGGLKFTLSRADIKSISFEAGNGEMIAGDFSVSSLDAESPEIARTGTEGSVITLTPQGECFEAGADYFIVMVPGALEGFTVRLATASSELLEFVSTRTQTIKRGVFGVLAKPLDDYADEVEGEYVDLGLSVKWATCNLGASVPEGYGDFFAWGEVEPKDGYVTENYKWYDSNNGYFTKYNSYNYGPMDNKLTLDPEDDAAHVILGGDWRMPTATEVAELIDTENCSWEWTEVNGINGYRVTSKKAGYTDNSIFIPSAGFSNYGTVRTVGEWGSYWSLSVMSRDYNDNTPERSSGFRTWGNREGYPAAEVYSGRRADGLSIRPVYGSWVPIEGISLPESITINRGETVTLDVTYNPSNATDRRFRCRSSNDSVLVTSLHTITGISPGKTTVTAYAGNGMTATCEVTVLGDPEPEMVDLGLSVKWANRNLGANKPESFGDYFAWAETDPFYEDGYAQSDNPVWKAGKEGGYALESNKYYSFDQYYDYFDYHFVLDQNDDAAHTRLGGDWRMPTVEELEELQNDCNWEWTTLEGVNGYKVSGKKAGYTDKSIFIPAAGSRSNTSLTDAGTSGSYWTSTLSPYGNGFSYCLNVASNRIGKDLGNRELGYAIRPVNGKFVPVEEISAPAILSMEVGQTVDFEVIVSPDNATVKSCRITSEDTSVATCDGTSVTGVAPGNTEISIFAHNGMCWSITVSVYKKPEPVDLGLSVKWASFNLGAGAPEDFGSFYAWGDVSPIERYGRWSNYIWGSPSGGFMKYNYNSDTGTIDGKLVLDAEDDAAHVVWGDDWRMPTSSEMEELLDNCSWEWTTENEVPGYRVTGKKAGYTDKSIFLPAAGYPSGYGYDEYYNEYIKNEYKGIRGYYWTSAMAILSYNPSSYACALYFMQDEIHAVHAEYGDGAHERFYGYPIRPVKGEKVDVTGVSVSPASVRLKVGQSRRIDVSVFPDNAGSKAYVCVSSDTSVATCDNGFVTAVAPGTATIKVYAGSGLCATCTVTVVELAAPRAPEMVDLGLSVKWAAWNLGANAPDETGVFYAWGETSPKETFSWNTYIWCGGSNTTLTRYNPSSDYGEVDNKTDFSDYDYADDAARATWGGGWRVPTESEIQELLNTDNCSWEYTEVEDVCGYRVTSKKPGYTDKSIFLPFAGYHSGSTLYGGGTRGDYWSSSLRTNRPERAYHLEIESGYKDIFSSKRSNGFNIRPVSE